MTAGERKIAIGLARRSSDRQENSLQDQIAEIGDAARARGEELLEVYQDDAISGSDLDRPGLQALLDFVETTDQHGTVIIWSRDRLCRPEEPLDGLVLEARIRQAGWTPHFLHGASATGNPLLDNILALIEHDRGGEYLRKLSLDSIRGQLRRVLNGEVPGGKVPYGYAKSIVDSDGRELRRIPRRAQHRKVATEQSRLVVGDPHEVDVVLWIFNEYAAGRAGLASLAESLNAREVASPQGGRWIAGTIRDILCNPVYVGDLVWNRETTSKFYRLIDKKPQKKDRRRKPSKAVKKKGAYAANDESQWVVVPGRYPALIDRDVRDQALARMKARAGARGGRRWVEGNYALTGLVFCANCGAQMTGRPTKVGKHEYRRYLCASHTQNRACEPYFVHADQLERAVIDRFKVTLSASPAIRAQLRTEIVSILTARLATSEPGLDADALVRERDGLQRKVRNAVERMGDIDHRETARLLAEQIEAWSKRISDLSGQIAAAQPGLSTRLPCGG